MCLAKLKQLFGKKPATDIDPALCGGPSSAIKPLTPAAAAVAWRLEEPLSYFTKYDQPAVLERAHDFAALSPEARAAAVPVMKEAIEGKLEELFAEENKKPLYDLAYEVTYAVYRSAIDLYDRKSDVMETVPYLHATAEVFYEWLQAHEIQVHFCTNCAYETYETVFNAYQEYFGAARLVYICAQRVALNMYQANGLTEAEYGLKDKELESYLNKAFFVARRLQMECSDKMRSYICLDADGNSRVYSQSMSYIGKPGHLVIERGGVLRQFDKEPKVYYPEDVVEAADAAEVKAEAVEAKAEAGE